MKQHNPNIYPRSRTFTKEDDRKTLFSAVSQEIYGVKVYYVGDTVEQVVQWIKGNHIGLHVARACYVRGRFDHTSEIGGFSPANGAPFFKNSDRIWS